MTKILIYSDSISPRLDYACKIIFEIILKMQYQVVDSQAAIKDSHIILINYSEEIIQGSFHIMPFGLLDEKGVKEFQVSHGLFEGETILFRTDSADFPFDIFSAVFYTVSRYEEYLPFKPDKYGRFPAEESIAYKLGFHRQPVVEIWSKILAKKLGLNYPLSDYKFKLTVDVDNAWMCRNKSFIRSLGSVLKSLVKAGFTETKNRLQILSGKKEDPFYTFGYLCERELKLKEPIQYFILVGNNRRYDRAVKIEKKEFRNLLMRLLGINSLGIHPSYQSNYTNGLAKKELDYLSGVLNMKICKSRQHYLLLKFPETFERLVSLGITEDYSMGWSNSTGFRAGISRPFPFFNLRTNEISGLTVVPFMCMDRTLKDYLYLSPEKALLEIKSLADKVKTTGGQFCMLWHNESLSEFGEWEGWRKVFEEGVEYANE